MLDDFSFGGLLPLRQGCPRICINAGTKRGTGETGEMGKNVPRRTTPILVPLRHSPLLVSRQDLGITICSLAFTAYVESEEIRASTEGTNCGH
jgi:hypothetical protein